MDSHFLAVSSYGGRGKGALWGLFSKATNLTYEGSTLMTSSPSKDPIFKYQNIGD